MGADLILSFVDVSEPKEKWLDILGEWDDGKVDRFVADSGNDDLIEDILENLVDILDLDGVDNEDPRRDDDALMAQARQQLVERLVDAINTVYGANSRVSHKVILDGKPWAVTGGLSWGDDPTDDFADFILAEAVVEHLKASA